MDERNEAQVADDSRAAAPDASTKWTPRVEGEEGDPTAFDYVFGGAVAVIVIGAILWAFGTISF